MLKAPYPNLPCCAPKEESTNHLKSALPESAKVVLGIENSIALLTVALSIFILASSLLQTADLAVFSARYDEILRRYNINHDQVDYDQYRLEHPDEFPGLAAEDTNTARTNLSREGRVSDLAAKAIAATTISVALFAAISPLMEKVIDTLISWLSAFHGSN